MVPTHCVAVVHRASGFLCQGKAAPIAEEMCQAQHVQVLQTLQRVERRRTHLKKQGAQASQHGSLQSRLP